MSWSRVEKSQKKNQKQNIIIEDEDFEGFSNDSIFAALSNIDNKKQKEMDENTDPNKEMKQSSSNSSLNSPKVSKKNQNTAMKTAPIQDLSKLVVTNFINKDIKINNNENDQIDQLKKLCNFIETEITNKLYCATTKFSNKSFDIDGPEFKGPIGYLAPKQRKEIENVFLKCKESVIKKLFTLITKCIFVGEKKDVSNQKLISNTIAHQICVQIISNLYPGILYKFGKDGKLVYDQIIGNNKASIEKLPALGNTLIWVCNQQRLKINKKEVYSPEYVKLWMEYFLNALASTDASVAIKTQSVKLLNRVLDDIKENKNKLDSNVEITLESFIALVAILKTENVVSQIRKYDKLYNGVINAYDSIKSLLFDPSSDILKFNVSNKVMFNKIYNILSDPKYDKAVYNEFLNILVFSFGKEQTLFDVWGTHYQQYQPNNIIRTKDILKEIRNQQIEYFKNKKYCPENNCWEEIDNNHLKNTLYTFIKKNEEYRNSKNDVEINEMNKIIKAILDKTTKNKNSKGLFSGFLMGLLKKTILFILIISLSIHIFDTIDSLTTDSKTHQPQLPKGHPPVLSNADISKCPYHNFKNKYIGCNQCHPVIKYVYNFMDEPYKYIETKGIIPFHKYVWEPYCTKLFMNTFVPSYRFAKPILTEKVMKPVHDNVFPKVAEIYDIYAKEHVDKANELVIKPVVSVSSKYIKEAYIVLKPVTIKTKNYIVNDVVKPSLPYINKAKVRAIQYGNQFLDTLADIPYRKLMKSAACNTLKFFGKVEKLMEELYDVSTPYVKKYWNVLSRKIEVIMEQENVQKIITNPYVKTTTHSIKNVYNTFCNGIKVSYVYLTKRGPQDSGAKNWKDATDQVSIKKDIKDSIKYTKKFFKGIIEQLENEEKYSGSSENSRSATNIKSEPKAESSKNKRESSETDSKDEVKKIKMNIKPKEEAKVVLKKKIDTPAKQLAKEKAKIKQEVKRIVKEDFENNVLKNKNKNESAKYIAKANVEATKKIIMEGPKEETKQIVKEHLESTKNIAMNAAVKYIIKKEKMAQEDPTKKVIKEKVETAKNGENESTAKRLAKENVESTKQAAKEAAAKHIAKENIESTKQAAKEAAAKHIAKENIESTKQAAKEAAAKYIAKENIESTKQAAKEAAAKHIAKENIESTKQAAKEAAFKHLAKESGESTKETTKETIKEAASKPITKENKESIKKTTKKPTNENNDKVKAETAKPIANETSAKPVAKETSAKQIAKENIESTKQAAKEAATKHFAKKNIESTKQAAKEAAVKHIAKENIESTKQAAKEAAAKHIAKENIESTKQAAKEAAAKHIAKENIESTKQAAKEAAAKSNAQE